MADIQPSRRTDTHSRFAEAASAWFSWARLAGYHVWKIIQLAVNSLDPHNRGGYIDP